MMMMMMMMMMVVVVVIRDADLKILFQGTDLCFAWMGEAPKGEGGAGKSQQWERGAVPLAPSPGDDTGKRHPALYSNLIFWFVPQ